MCVGGGSRDKKQIDRVSDSVCVGGGSRDKKQIDRVSDSVCRWFRLVHLRRERGGGGYISAFID